MDAGISGIVRMDNVIDKSNIQPPDNAKTRQATRYGVRLFREYCSQHGVDTINNLPARDIARMLKGFYGQARTKDGQRFSVNSLIAIRYAISRYYRSPMVQKKIDIVKDNVFNEANETFRAVLKDLERESRGTTCQKELQMVDMDDRRKLRHYFEHAISTPRGLLQKVWYDLMLRVGRRGRESQRMLNRNSFRIAKAADGRQYIYQVDDEEAGIILEIPGDPLCPVKTLRFYLSRLNPACRALFQRPKEHVYDQDTCWYVNSPVGKNMLATMMSTISKCARLSRVYTNVRIRATTYSPADGKGCIPCPDMAEKTNAHGRGSASASATKPDGKSREIRIAPKPLLPQNSQIIKQLNAPVGQHCLPQRLVVSEAVSMVSNCVNSTVGSNVFPVALTVATSETVNGQVTSEQNGEITTATHCDWCKKKLDSLGGIMLTSNEGGKEYCSTECLAKWIASEQPQNPAFTSEVAAENSEKNKEFSTDNKFQKLLTFCSSANLLVPFSPSVSTDYAGYHLNDTSGSNDDISRTECRSVSPLLIVPDEIPPESLVDTIVPETKTEACSTNFSSLSDAQKETCDQEVMCQPNTSSLAILCKPIVRSQGIQTEFATYWSSHFWGKDGFYNSYINSNGVSNDISKDEEYDDTSDVEEQSVMNGDDYEYFEDNCETSSLRVNID